MYSCIPVISYQKVNFELVLFLEVLCYSFAQYFDVARLVFSETKKSRASDKEKASAQGGLESEGVFEELLRTSGIILKAGEGQNEIGMDLTLVLSVCVLKPAKMTVTK